MWVRSKYASELAVVAAWVAVFVPWNLAYNTREWASDFGTIEASTFFVRFPFAEIQLRTGSIEQQAGGATIAHDISPLEAAAYPGTELFGDVFLATPVQAVQFYDGTLWQASLLWLVAALAMAGALVFSVALYAREDRVVDTLPVSQVRLMGGLLAIVALGTGGASVLQFLERGAVGTPVPVGVLVVGALAAVLLRTEAIPDDESAEATTTEDAESTTEG